MPFFGAERARAVLEWWSQLGSLCVRLSAVFVLAFGGFIAYACAPSGTSGAAPAGAPRG